MGDVPGLTTEEQTQSQSILLTDKGELRLPGSKAIIVDGAHARDIRSSDVNILLPGLVIMVRAQAS